MIMKKKVEEVGTTTGIYGVKDIVANRFLGLNLYENDDMAIRDFDFMLGQEGTLFNARPDDFQLYRLSEIDMATGLIVLSDKYLVKEGR